VDKLLLLKIALEKLLSLLKPFAQNNAYIYAALGFFYSLYCSVFFMFLAGHGSDKVRLEESFVSTVFLFIGLGPWGFGFAALFYIAYCRYKLASLAWLLFSLLGGVVVTHYQFGELPNSLQMINLFKKLTRDTLSTGLFFVPHALVGSMLLFWLLTPKPRKEPKIVSKSTDLP
jgi:hypothetical protein